MKYWKRSYTQYLEETIFQFVVVEKIRFLILIVRNLCADSGGARDRPYLQIATLLTTLLATLLATLPCHVTLPRPK